MNTGCGPFGILNMTDFQDLQTRVGQVELSIRQSDDKHRDLLNGLQSGLTTARENLTRMMFEIDRLSEENIELKQLIERLLDSVEGESKNALHNKLEDLTAQLNEILGASEEDIAIALGQVGEDLVQASQSNNADCSSDEPTNILSVEPNDSSLAESSSLHDLKIRAQNLSCKLME
jgi:predicted  nucleic acid-binding Zn-ribbon protein